MIYKVNDIQDSGGNSHLPSASEEIITFYSDRNLKEKMIFKNPVLKENSKEIINQGKYTSHPHKTMDTPLSETIAESTIQREALSKELEKSFL